MDETPVEAPTLDATPSEPFGGTTPLTGRARSLANLRPPLRPGDRLNPSGKTKDGRPAKTARIDAELDRQLARRQATKRLVARWVKDACDAEDGNVAAKAREQILQRLYPVPQDAGSKRVVLEGLRLELTPGGGAVATTQRLEAPASGVESFVKSEESESREGGASTQVQGQQSILAETPSESLNLPSQSTDDERMQGETVLPSLHLLPPSSSEGGNAAVSADEKAPTPEK